MKLSVFWMAFETPMYHEKKIFTAVDKVKAMLEKGIEPYPLVVEFYPTNRCNLSCSFCFGAEKAQVVDSRKELEVQQYKIVLNELRELGVRHISFSGGGEPFLYSQIRDVLELGIEHDFNFRLVTNGTLIKKSDYPTLSKIDEIRFSINAIFPSTYSLITSSKSAYLSAILQHISNLVKMKSHLGYGPQIGASLTIQEENIDEVYLFIETMLLDYAVDSVIIKNDIYESTLEHIEKSFDFSDKLNELKSKLHSTQNIELRQPLKDENVGRIPCFVPYFKVAINPYGDVFTCCLGAQPEDQGGYLLGNLLHSSFESIWKKSYSSRINLQRNLHDCQSCNYNDHKINTQFLGYKNEVR